MSKSELVQTLDIVQARLSPILKERKYKSKGRNFNCATSDGLTHVVHVQMGGFDPPNATYVTGLTRNLYGKFTINCGVFVPEVAEQSDSRPSSSFIPEHNCCLRARLGRLGPERVDLWWNITVDGEIADEIARRLERDAFPFLARFESRDAILAELRPVADPFYVGTPPRIICAIILASRGQRAEARELLALQVVETRNPGHPAYVRKLADRLGVSLSN